jgi:hypothetical protein
MSAQHRARKRLLIGELGVSPAAFDVMRKLDKLKPEEAPNLFRDAYQFLQPGQQLNWLDAVGEPTQQEPEPTVSVEASERETNARASWLTVALTR